MNAGRVVLALYPPAWRARYGDEVLAFLEEGAGPRALASLAWRAAPAWIWPAGHLHDRPARMRASIATVLAAWTALAGLAMVFGTLAQNQHSLQDDITGPRQLVVTLAYWVFDAAAAASLLTVVAGGLPLWLDMFRRARGEHRTGVLACLLAPVIVPAGYLAVSAVAVGMLRRPATVTTTRPALLEVANANVGPAWFLALVAVGFVAAGLGAAGPMVALRRLSPSGPAVTVAVRATRFAAVTMSLAGAASIVAVLSLYQWAPAYHQSWQPALYLPAVVLACAVASVSAARGGRSAQAA